MNECRFAFPPFDEMALCDIAAQRQQQVQCARVSTPSATERALRRFAMSRLAGQLVAAMISRRDGYFCTCGSVRALSGRFQIHGRPDPLRGWSAM